MIINFEFNLKWCTVEISLVWSSLVQCCPVLCGLIQFCDAGRSLCEDEEDECETCSVSGAKQQFDHLSQRADEGGRKKGNSTSGF